MFTPSPGLWPALIEDRQHRLRGAFDAGHPATRGGIRVRLGHLLIAAGSTLSGERVDVGAHRSPALSRSA